MIVGIDVHKNYCEATSIDENGKPTGRWRFKNQNEAIEEFLPNLPPGTRVAMESCSYFYPLYNKLEREGFQVCVAHPLKVKLIAESRNKNDRVDANILAQLLRMNYLPTSYIPPEQTRQTRDLLRYRAALARQRTQVTNRIHHLLEKQGIKTSQLSHSDLHSKKAQENLAQLQLPPIERTVLDMELNLVQALNGAIEKANIEIAKQAKENSQVKLLMTIPGINYYSAMLLLAEIGDINRFPDAKKLCAYAGLVPSVSQSGTRTIYGHITKQGNRWIRFVLVEAAQRTTTIQQNSPLSAMYQRIKARKGSAIAKVACARKLLKIIWYMLTRNEPYRYMDQEMFAGKQKRLMRTASKA
jgi:transposase